MFKMLILCTYTNGMVQTILNIELFYVHNVEIICTYTNSEGPNYLNDLANFVFTMLRKCVHIQ